MYMVLLAVALTSQAPSAAPSSGEAGTIAEAYYLFLEGQRLEEGSDLGGAADRYRQALVLVPRAAGIHAELAGVYAQQGDLARAQAEAETALTIAPDHRPAHRLLGLIAASSIDDAAPDEAAATVRRAITHLEQARGAGLPDPTVVLTLGEMYVRAADYARAIPILQGFLLDRPGYPQAVMLLVQAYRASGQTEAAEELVRSFRGTPASTLAGRLRGIEGLERRGLWAEAAEAWGQLVEEQDDPNYRLRHAAALVNSGQIDAGREQLDALTAEVPDDIRPWYLLAQVEMRAGRTAEAEAAARRIGEIDPGDGRGPIALAMVLGARRDFKGIVNVLTPHVEGPSDRSLESGTFGEMARLLGGAYRDMGQVRESIRTLEGALVRTPEDAQILFTLGATYERDEQFDRAETVFRQLIQIDPEHAPALNYLGYMLADRGEKLEEALSLIERAIEAGGESPSYLDSLGWAYYRLERFDEAVGPLERAAEGAPDVSVIQEHLGDTYLELGRYGQAAEAFERALGGDREDVDTGDLERKRDRARAAAGIDQR